MPRPFRLDLGLLVLLVMASLLLCAAPSMATEQGRVITHGRCDLAGTYDVMKSGSTRVLGAASIACGKASGECIAKDGDREAKLEPRSYNIHRWLVSKVRGDENWPRRFLATEGKGCTQILFSNGTLWRRR
jgi:hypothetical protein